MNRITLAMLIVAAAATVGAQTRPVTPPAKPARPAPAPRAEVAPRPVIEPGFMDIDGLRLNREFMEFDRDAVRELARQATELARAQSSIDVDWVREQARWASEQARLDGDMVRQRAEMARDMVHDLAPMTPMSPMAPMAPMAPMTPFPAIAPEMPLPRMLNGISDGLRVPLPVFHQGEPEDSLYRLAHDVLNRGDYGRAAQMFRDIQQKYPKSVYMNDAQYYEAWARYRIGTTEELRAAAKLLEGRAKIDGTATSSTATRFVSTRRPASDGDVTGLYIRINSALAQRGDRDAADKVAKAAQAGANTCDRDEMAVRVEAMSALSQMDATDAMPMLKRVLDQKDDCTTQLRQRAIFILGRRGDAEAANLIAAAAKSDPAPVVRADAIAWLPKLQGDAGVNMLEEILRTEQDERLQRSVVRALVTSDNQRARASMRTLIDRKDAAINLRVEAISSFNNDRATADDAAYLRSLYGRADNDRIKEAVIGALGRIGGQENDQWLLTLAKNQNEPSQFRAAALGRLMRANIPVADLMKLYEASESRNVRQQIVSQLERRQGTEAADKLFEIVRTSTDPNIKTQAFGALARRKDDPRSVQLMKDIIEGKRP